MTRVQGLELAATGALGLFFVGIVTMLAWRLQERQTRRRHAPRFEPPRQMTVVLDNSTARFEPITEITVELPVIVCPGCGRNAGHNAGCPQALGLRASQIDVPREGKPQ